MSRLTRLLLVAGGLAVTALGILGIVLPVLPTTPFLLLAAILFARSSPRLHRWLRSSRITGPFIRAYTEGGGLSRRRKAFTIGLLWAALGLSAILTREIRWLPVILGIVGVGVTIHIATIPTRRYFDENHPDSGGTAGSDAADRVEPRRTGHREGRSMALRRGEGRHPGDEQGPK